jgi:hypothetical protein
MTGRNIATQGFFSLGPIADIANREISSDTSAACCRHGFWSAFEAACSLNKDCFQPIAESSL